MIPLYGAGTGTAANSCHAPAEINGGKLEVAGKCLIKRNLFPRYQVGQLSDPGSLNDGASGNLGFRGRKCVIFARIRTLGLPLCPRAAPALAA
ncbi:hypothetical protein NDU88_010848 [Pleurodeles waltl]|uniref:Uncharacterized protein n=1 Tax=Pleurodeles waltl TaxID=8319 RepID=A0AAV7PX88_PLEWA|nr:hypothetical protein NDU88_010848 [Pleurodeles waltl]